jgi:hypothetical protein
MLRKGSLGRDWMVYGDDVEPLRLLVIYAPPGSERGLRDLPGCQVLSPGEVPQLSEGDSRIW